MGRQNRRWIKVPVERWVIGRRSPAGPERGRKPLIRGVQHSVFVWLSRNPKPDKKSVYSNFNAMRCFKKLKHLPCLKRGSRDELLGDGNLLKQYVGTCELNKCIKRHSTQ